MLSTSNLRKNPFEFMCSVTPRVKIGGKVERKEFSPILTLDLKKARKVCKRFKVQVQEPPPEVGEDKATRWNVLKTFELAVEASMGYIFKAKAEDYTPGFSPPEVVSAALGENAEELVQSTQAAGYGGTLGFMLAQAMFDGYSSRLQNQPELNFGKLDDLWSLYLTMERVERSIEIAEV